MSPDVGKLRELAEVQLAETAEPCDCGGCECARGLLSALDALEAANKEADEYTRMAEEVLISLRASRDQAIKERDDWQLHAETWEDRLVIVRAERDRLAEALARAAFVASHLLGMIDQDTWRAEGGDDGQGHYEGEYRAARLAEEIDGWAALAGVPGGREHNFPPIETINPAGDNPVRQTYSSHPGVPGGSPQEWGGNVDAENAKLGYESALPALLARLDALEKVAEAASGDWRDRFEVSYTEAARGFLRGFTVCEVELAKALARLREGEA